MACTVYFIFRDVGTWEPFAENIFVFFYDWYNTEAEGRGSTGWLSKARCIIFPFITTGKYIYEEKKREVMQSNEEINPSCLKVYVTPKIYRKKKVLRDHLESDSDGSAQGGFTYLLWKITTDDKSVVL